MSRNGPVIPFIYERARAGNRKAHAAQESNLQRQASTLKHHPEDYVQYLCARNASVP
jgi:hypothetical protein